MVQLRVRPDEAAAAVTALQLPERALQRRGKDPVAHWLGPDRWLLTSDILSSESIIEHVDHALSGQLHAATDTSSGKACFSLRGPTARMILAMGCGNDMHNSAFTTGQCIQTNFAKVLLLIVVAEENSFDLYVDRSHAGYLRDWLLASGTDPITRDSKNYPVAVS